MKTKEKILIEALRLFSVSGYKAVSLSDIAGKVGITKGALYRHYKNKRDILDSIIDKMRENDAARAEQFNVPKDVFEDIPDEYKNTPFKELIAYTKAQFEYWTEDEFASCFRKMLSIERYCDKEMERLYGAYILEGVLKYLEDIFRETKYMTEDKKNPKLLAVEFFSAFYMLMSLYDMVEDKENVKRLFCEHLRQYCII